MKLTGVQVREQMYENENFVNAENEFSLTAKDMFDDKIFNSA